MSKREVTLGVLGKMTNAFLGFEIMVDTMQRYMTEQQVKLTDAEIRGLADIYFKQNETVEQLGRANQLYQELDHTNNMINIGEGVGLKYV
jgi:hypothetical protein